MNLQGIKILLIPLEVLKESWGNVRGLLETGATTFQEFRDLISKWFVRKRHVLGIL